jgi:hypothetical protein
MKMGTIASPWRCDAFDCHDFLPAFAIIPHRKAPGELEMSAARLKHFGWGREGEGLTAEEEAFVIARAESMN